MPPTLKSKPNNDRTPARDLHKLQPPTAIRVNRQNICVFRKQIAPQRQLKPCTVFCTLEDILIPTAELLYTFETSHAYLNLEFVGEVDGRERSLGVAFRREGALHLHQRLPSPSATQARRATGGTQPHTGVGKR